VADLEAAMPGVITQPTREVAFVEPENLED